MVKFVVENISEWKRTAEMYLRCEFDKLSFEIKLLNRCLLSLHDDTLSISFKDFKMKDYMPLVFASAGLSKIETVDGEEEWRFKKCPDIYNLGLIFNIIIINCIIQGHEEEEENILERERLERERLETIRATEFLRRDLLERERLTKGALAILEEERLESERLHKEYLARESLEKERLEKERLEKERVERERAEKERLDREFIDKRILEILDRNLLERVSE